MRLKRISELLYRRKRTILWSTLVTATVFFGGSYLIAPTYRACSKVVIPYKDAQAVLSRQEVSGGPDGRSPGVERPSFTTAFTASRSYIDELAFKLQLRQQNGNLMTVENLLSDGILFKAVKWLIPSPSVEIRQSQGADLMEIVSTAPNPFESMMMANTLAKIVVEQKKAETKSEFSKVRAAVQNYLDEIKIDYQSNVEQIAHIKKRQETVDLKTEVRLAAEKMTRLLNEKENTVTELAQTRAKVIHLNKQLSKQQPGALSASTLNAHPQIESLKKQLTTLRLELAKASAELTSEHPKMVALTEQIAAAEEELAEEIASFRKSAPELANLEREIVALEARRQAINGNLDEHVRRIGELSDKALKQASFDMTMETAPKYYSAFLDSLHTLNVAEAAAVAGIKIVDPASRPVSPLFPKKGLNAVLGVLGGLILGLILAAVKEYFDDTIRSAQDVQILTPAVLIGAVPRFEAEKICLISDRDPNDPLSESYRRLRTTFELAGDMGNEAVRSLLITSAGPEEGKTTTVVNLGISMAREGKDVVLVDTDLRRPSLHKYFGLRNDIGLAEVLQRKCGMERAIQRTSIKGLNVLAGGSPCPDPGALLESNQTGFLISKLQSVWDVVILDTAPLLVKTDALNMARYVDRSVVVVESECTTRSAFVDIMGNLAKVHLEPLGVVLNKCPVRGGSGRYEQYGYTGYKGDAIRYKSRRRITAPTPKGGVQGL